MLKGRIEFTGDNADAVRVALEEALARIEAGNTSGFDRSEDSSFSFTVDTEREPVDPDTPCPCGQGHTRGEHGYDPDAEADLARVEDLAAAHEDVLNELMHEVASQEAADAFNAGEGIDYLLARGWSLSQIAERLGEEEEQ